MCKNKPAFTSWEDGLYPEWETLAGMKEREKYFKDDKALLEIFFIHCQTALHSVLLFVVVGCLAVYLFQTLCGETEFFQVCFGSICNSSQSSQIATLIIVAFSLIKHIKKGM